MSEGWDEKVTKIFQEGFGERGARARAMPLNEIAKSLKDLDPQIAGDIAFHLTDWLREAAFLVALAMFPERFSSEEIAAGVTASLIHIPNHITAAATLGGWPMKDIFGVGAEIEPASVDKPPL